MHSPLENASYRSTCPELTRPSDFFGFWEETLDALNKTKLTCQIKHTVKHRHGLTEQRLEFNSLGDIPVTAYSLRWDDEQSRPLVVYTHGYAGQCEVMLNWARQGMNIVGVDLRGMGRSKTSLPELSPYGYILTGIESPQQSILRGVVCDFIRACEIGQSVLSTNISRVIFHGHSFGGAISLMAAAVTHIPDILVNGVPTLGWVEGRLQLVKQGSGLEIINYLHQHPHNKTTTQHVLAYFDTMNFADRVACPTLIGVGTHDEVVPAATVYAITNHLQCPLEIREFPFSHSKRQEEVLWDQFEVEWLQLAQTGVDAGFGREQDSFRQILA